MRNEIANQLLVRVQDEMTHNIETVKNNLIEWLERPESGGVEFFCEKLVEVSGALFLLNRSKSAKFSQVLSDDIKILNEKLTEKTIDNKTFGLIGAEIASGLLLLDDYIVRLGTVSENDDEQLIASAKTIHSMISGQKKVPLVLQSRIDRETYKALSERVSETMAVAKNQIEQYGVSLNEKSFGAQTLIDNNNDLIGLFALLKLDAPQLLLERINQLITKKLSEIQWFDVAESILLVDGVLKKDTHISQELIADIESALKAQTMHSRYLEKLALTSAIAEMARDSYESLRKVVANEEMIKTAQGWHHIALETFHFSSVLQIIEEAELSRVLFALSQIFVEVSLGKEHPKDLVGSIMDVLVGVEYVFSDLVDTAEVNRDDLLFLHQVTKKLKKEYPISSQAQKIVAGFATLETVAKSEDENLGMPQDFDLMLSGLDALDEDFDGVLGKKVSKSEDSDIKEDLFSSNASEVLQTYFDDKSLEDLEKFEIPDDKKEFLQSSADAIIDDEIREFFLEELTEKIDEIKLQLAPWADNPSDENCIGVVRRAFHTIKGSGKTVGYESLGECAWQHEHMLNRVIDKTFSANNIVQEVIGETVQLFAILTTANGFVEKKAALLTQASLAEKLTKKLVENTHDTDDQLREYLKEVRRGLASSEMMSSTQGLLVAEETALGGVEEVAESKGDAALEVQKNKEEAVQKTSRIPLSDITKEIANDELRRFSPQKISAGESDIATSRDDSVSNVSMSELFETELSTENEFTDSCHQDRAEDDMVEEASDPLEAASLEKTGYISPAENFSSENIFQTDEEIFSEDALDVSLEDELTQEKKVRAGDSIEESLLAVDAATFSEDSLDLGGAEEILELETVQKISVGESDIATSRDDSVSNVAMSELFETELSTENEFTDSCHQDRAEDDMVEEASDPLEAASLEKTGYISPAENFSSENIFQTDEEIFSEDALDFSLENEELESTVDVNISSLSATFANRGIYTDRTLSDLDDIAISDAIEKSIVESTVDENDEEILSFFLEELDENVAQIDSALPLWEHEPQADQYHDDIRRAFHTIKGSGKTMGYKSLGEFASQYEHLLNAIGEKQFNVNEFVFNAIADSIDLLRLLRTGDGFVEHRKALLNQASLVEVLCQTLTQNPDVMLFDKTNKDMMSEFDDIDISVSEEIPFDLDGINADVDLKEATVTKEESVTAASVYSDAMNDRLEVSTESSVVSEIDELSNASEEKPVATLVPDHVGSVEAEYTHYESIVGEVKESAKTDVVHTDKSATIADAEEISQLNKPKLSEELAAILEHSIEGNEISSEEAAVLTNIFSKKVQTEASSLSLEDLQHLSGEVSNNLSGRVEPAQIAQLLGVPRVDLQPQSQNPRLNAAMLSQAERTRLSQDLAAILEHSIEGNEISSEEAAVLTNIFSKKVQTEASSLSLEDLQHLSGEVSNNLSGRVEPAQIAQLLGVPRVDLQPQSQNPRLNAAMLSQAERTRLSQDLAAILEHSIEGNEISSEEAAVLTNVFSKKLQTEASSLSVEDLQHLSGEVSNNLSGRVEPAQIAQLLGVPDVAMQIQNAVAKSYQHMSKMLEQSLAAQPLDESDETILAKAFEQELQQIEKNPQEPEVRETVFAELLQLAPQGVDHDAYRSLLESVVNRVIGQSDLAEFNAEELARVVDVAKQITAGGEFDHVDEQILSQQLKEIIADKGTQARQRVQAHLQEALSHDNMTSTLVDNAFSQLDEDTLDALNDIYDEEEETSLGAENITATESAEDLHTVGIEDSVALDEDFELQDEEEYFSQEMEKAEVFQGQGSVEQEMMVEAVDENIADAAVVALEDSEIESSQLDIDDAANLEESSVGHGKTVAENLAQFGGINTAETLLPSSLLNASMPQVPQISRKNIGSQRLSDELSKISAHPVISGALSSHEKSAESDMASFLNAIDQFDSLSKQAETGGSPEMVDRLIDSVYDIEDTLDTESAPDWIWRMLDAIEQLLLAYKGRGGGIAPNATSILRQSIDLIENYGNQENEDDATQTISSLLQERKQVQHVAKSAPVSAHKSVAMSESVPLVSPQTVESVDFSEQSAHHMASAEEEMAWEAMTPDPNAGDELVQIFLDEAVALLGNSQSEADRWDNNRENLAHLDMIRRDMHTLKGGARMSGYTALGDLIHAVESMIESIIDGHSEANDKSVAILSGSIWQAMVMLDVVRDGYLPQTDPYMLNNIHEFLNLPLPYPRVAEEERRIKEEQKTQQPMQSDSNYAEETGSIQTKTDECATKEEPAVAFDESIDPVLVDIFSDEAQELIDQAETLLDDDLKNPEVVEELKRNMHTLKGGARLVGLNAIGDTSHLMESVIEKVDDYSDTKMRQATTLLKMGHEALYSMLDNILRQEMPVAAIGINESLELFAIEGRYKKPEISGESKSLEGQVQKVEYQAMASVQPLAPEQISTSHADDVSINLTNKNNVKETKVQEQASLGMITDDAASRLAPEKTSLATDEQAKTGDQQADKSSKTEDDKSQEKSSPETRKSEAVVNEVQRFVRVDSGLLDEMIAMIGETAIMRSRLDNVSRDSEFNLTELTRIASRIDQQMRRLDNQTEAQMLFRRDAQEQDDEHFDPLEMDRFSEVQQLSRQLSEAIDDLKNVQETLATENTLMRNLSIQQGMIQRSIQEKLLTTQLIRFDTNEARLKRLVKQTAKSVNKEVNLVIEGGHVELERRLIEDVLPAMEHMIRNSIGHGIESAQERQAAGKSEEGTVKIIVEAKASNVEIRILDDGRGFNYDNIREKARAKGWLDEKLADDHQYLNTLMMRSGFSTAVSVTQLSGRGVGMDVVSEMVKQRRGQIHADSITGKGAQFIITMPFSMSISEVLLVEVAEDLYAAPMNAIAAVHQVPKEYLVRSAADEEVFYQYDGTDYRLYILGNYFDPVGYEFSSEIDTAPVLFIDAGGKPVAFFVDRIANRLEVIVKNVNRQVLNIPGISGATILGDGNVVPVLELLDLSRKISGLSVVADKEVVEEEVQAKQILVVDDSVTMRKVSTRLLERNDYVVQSAKDGLDAIDVLQTFTPDLILLDIEMPRMDGFEFASHIRQKSNIKEVPIVMVTSRTGEKHRERANEIGVQGYLGKPYREDILIETLESLIGEKADG